MLCLEFVYAFAFIFKCIIGSTFRYQCITFRYHYSLKALTEGNEEAQQCVLQAVHEHWSNYPQVSRQAFDALEKSQVEKSSSSQDNV